MEQLKIVIERPLLRADGISHKRMRLVNPMNPLRKYFDHQMDTIYLIPNGEDPAKDEIFCLFEGIFDNLGSLVQQYGLSKSSNEVLLVIEAYKALRDRAPYPASSMLGHLSGNFAFVLFDNKTSTVLVASDADAKIPLFWGITADGCLAFADDVEILKGSCGKSLAPFPQGCFYSNTLGGLKSYEHPKKKVTATLADEEEICGATFKVINAHFVSLSLNCSSFLGRLCLPLARRFCSGEFGGKRHLFRIYVFHDSAFDGLHEKITSFKLKGSPVD
ncbi:Stem-specific protein TSJT1 [Platanthera zijinensis]|uniref:Stem-specific protein TSJT1 n=1 Tax=Platanthera zijinensis TaxID=2320716 RepID=A0AAP0C0I6_9ASPA